jgi:Ca-activated chloride channel family protein
MTTQRVYPLAPWLLGVVIGPIAILALAVGLAVTTNREDLLFDRLDLWWLAAAVPVAGLVCLYGVLRRRRAISAFASAKLAPLLTHRVSPSRQAVRAGLVVAAIALLTLGIIGPRWGVYVQKQQIYGRDIVVALDVSRSMLAADVEPNRFERAKREIRQQLTERGAFSQENRLALLGFAGSTSLRMPLTTDTVAFRSKLEQLQIGSVPKGGTAIGEAITAARELFTKSPTEAEKFILLFTDGEDHEGGPVGAAKSAFQDQGVRVFTVGVGDPARTIGAQVPNAPGSDKPLLHDGQIVFSKLNEDSLREIATAGGGDYAPVQQLFRLVNRIGSMKKAELTAEERTRHQPRYQWFVAAALVLLVLEGLISEAGRPSAAQPLRVWQQEAA